jgi:hypothetical protein
VSTGCLWKVFKDDWSQLVIDTWRRGDDGLELGGWKIGPLQTPVHLLGLGRSGQASMWSQRQQELKEGKRYGCDGRGRRE